MFHYYSHFFQNGAEKCGADFSMYGLIAHLP